MNSALVDGNSAIGGRHRKHVVGLRHARRLALFERQT